MKLFNIYQSYVKRTGLLKCHFYPSKWFENKIRIQKISSFGASWNIGSLPYDNILRSSEHCGLSFLSPKSPVSAHLSQLDTPRLGAARESWAPAFLCSLCRLLSPYDWDVRRKLKAFRTTLSLQTRKVASPPQTWCHQLRPLLPLLMEKWKPVCMSDLPLPATTPGYSAMKRNLTLKKKIKTFPHPKAKVEWNQRLSS